MFTKILLCAAFSVLVRSQSRDFEERASSSSGEVPSCWLRLRSIVNDGNTNYRYDRESLGSQKNIFNGAERAHPIRGTESNGQHRTSYDTRLNSGSSNDRTFSTDTSLNVSQGMRNTARDVVGTATETVRGVENGFVNLIFRAISPSSRWNATAEQSNIRDSNRNYFRSNSQYRTDSENSNSRSLLVDTVLNISHGVGNTVQGVVDTAVQTARGVGNGLRNTVQGVVGTAVDTVQNVENGVRNTVQGVVGTTLQTARGVENGLRNTVQGVVGTAVETVRGVENGVINLVSHLLPPSRSRSTAENSYVRETARDSREIESSLQLDVGRTRRSDSANLNGRNLLTDTVASVSQGLGNTIQGVIGTAVHTARGVENGLRNTVQNVVGTAVETARHVENGVRNTVQGVVGTAIETVLGVENGLRNTVQGVVGTTFQTARGVENGLRRTAEGVVGTAVQTIRGVENGLKNTVQGVVGRVIETIRVVENGVVYLISRVVLPRSRSNQTTENSNVQLDMRQSSHTNSANSNNRLSLSDYILNATRSSKSHVRGVLNIATNSVHGLESDLATLISRVIFPSQRSRYLRAQYSDNEINHNADGVVNTESDDSMEDGIAIVITRVSLPSKRHNLTTTHSYIIESGSNSASIDENIQSGMRQSRHSEWEYTNDDLSFLRRPGVHISTSINDDDSDAPITEEEIDRVIAAAAENLQNRNETSQSNTRLSEEISSRTH